MALAEWWRGDISQRFWLEITNRNDVGHNLIAPQRDDAGREYWSYSLVMAVRPGDVVLHWSKLGQPRVVGYSHVSGVSSDSRMVWQSRGTYGRRHEPTGEEAAWEAPLSGFCALAREVTLETVRRRAQQVRAVREDLLGRYGAPLYFPFEVSERRPPRAAQAYLVKFPAELVAVFPELLELDQLASNRPGEDEQPRSQASRSPRSSNVERRRAVERYAVSLVINHLQDQGYDVEDVGAVHPWDVTARRGQRELHVEVKGSAVDREAIDLTEGEVRHAEDTFDTMLIVVDQIEVSADLRCSGGRWRYWPNWRADRERLVATAYRYVLHAGVAGRPPDP